MLADFEYRYNSPALVVGFHGCNRETADDVIKHGARMIQSEQAHDWLGHGVYFWEGSYQRAWQWAIQKHREDAAVIGAFIKLGHCIDLLDIHWTEQLRDIYEVLKDEYESFGNTLPQNRIADHTGITFVRELDCAVMMKLHSLIDDAIARESGFWNENKSSYSDSEKALIQNHALYADSVRGMFPEGDELYSGAGFREKNHIQICIRNPNCIVGFFEPRAINPNYKVL